MAVGERGNMTTLEQFKVCEGCRHFYNNACTYDSYNYPDCWEAEDIVNPLERYLERKSEFKLKGDRDG